MRILYVVKNLRVSNGVSSYIMNYYREIIKKGNIQIDFLVVSDVGSPYYDEIKDNGSNIYYLPSFKHVFKILKFLKNIFKNNNYNILHSNVFNSNFLIAYIAKKYNVPVRILHSHATSNGDSLLKKIRNKPFQFFSIHYSNYLFACSNMAGKCIYKNKKFYVVNNAIDLDKFRYNDNLRNKIRKYEKINDEQIVIATVGRITEQKNPYFILDIIKELYKKERNFIFWWFGSGNLDRNIRRKAEEMNIEHLIKFYGSINDVFNYYSAMDIFILPSLYEGLPVVGIEAQANGLKCFFSNSITNEVKMIESTIFLPINSPKEWSKLIFEFKDRYYERFINDKKLQKNYNIKSLSNNLIKKYVELLEKEESK